MGNPAYNLHSRPQPGSQEEADSKRNSLSCLKCGAELRLGAEFCHICGRWVYGSSAARLVQQTRKTLARQDVDWPVTACLIVATLFSVIAIFAGIRIQAQTVTEWQIVQILRIEWMLGAIIVLLFGLLFKRKP
ncbi:MAG: zinc ribbon domain-containing protein [Acidobacteriota bacterium]